MAYLTFDDYQSMGGLVEQANFDRLEQSAEYAINNATRDYFRLHSLDDEPDKFMADDFKRAVYEQIEYMDYLGGGQSYTQADNSFKSISIGRLSMTPGGNKDNSTTQARNGLCREAYELLGKHGLLWRGV